jgi:hypothetical protein
MLARHLPAFIFCCLDTLIVHNRRLTHVVPSPSESYTFLETAQLTQDEFGATALRHPFPLEIFTRVPLLP